MPPHLLTNFEIQIYYQNEPKFNVAYSRNNLPKINSTALRYRSFSEKISKKSTCVIMIRIIAIFAN